MIGTLIYVLIIEKCAWTDRLVELQLWTCLAYFWQPIMFSLYVVVLSDCSHWVQIVPYKPKLSAKPLTFAFTWQIADLIEKCAWTDRLVELQLWTRLAYLAFDNREHNTVLRAAAKALYFGDKGTQPKGKKQEPYVLCSIVRQTYVLLMSRCVYWENKQFTYVYSCLMYDRIKKLLCKE